jgi:hypothetical protein
MIGRGDTGFYPEDSLQEFVLNRAFHGLFGGSHIRQPVGLASGK